MGIWTVRQIVHAILKEAFNLSVFGFIVKSECLKVMGKLVHFYHQFIVFCRKISIFSGQIFKMRFQLFYFQQPFLLDYWFLNINRVLNWDLNWNLDPNRHFNYFLPLDGRLLNVNRPVDIYRFLHYRWHFDCNSSYDLSRYFLDNFNGHFLLNFNVFRNLNNLLNYSFWTRNRFYNFYYNLNRFLYNNLLYNFFWGSLHKPLYLILPFFQQFFDHIQINRQSIVLSFLFSNNPIVIVAYL